MAYDDVNVIRLFGVFFVSFLDFIDWLRASCENADRFPILTFLGLS